MSATRNRSLLIVGAAESVSGIGNWITMMAVFAIVVFQGQGSVAESSGIFLAGLVPTLFASPAAGWLCDRFDRKRLMIASELLDAFVVLGLIFAQQLQIIYGLLALQAVVMSIMSPARQAIVPDLVRGDELTNANALLQQLSGLVKVGAPVLAGALLAALGPHTAIILDVISFLLSAAILSRLPALPPHRIGAAGKSRAPAAELPAPLPPSRGEPPPAAGLGTLALLRSSTGLRLLFAGIFLAIMVIVGFDVLSALVTRDLLQGNEGLYGLLIGAVGLGTAAAALLLMLRGRGRDPWPDVTLGLALLACLPASVALAARLPTPALGRLSLIAGCLVGGVGNGLANVQVGTLLQQLSPPALLGRVSGLFQSTAVAGQLVGIVLTPLLVPVPLSIGNFFAIASAALAALVVYLLVNLPRQAGRASHTGQIAERRG